MSQLQGPTPPGSTPASATPASSAPSSAHSEPTPVGSKIGAWTACILLIVATAAGLLAMILTSMWLAVAAGVALVAGLVFGVTSKIMDQYE